MMINNAITISIILLMINLAIDMYQTSSKFLFRRKEACSLLIHFSRIWYMLITPKRAC